ncbi:MAG: autotransporter-associated beta strand repeat-containing protein [Tepidisphaeraceae bacterium]
MANFQTTGAGAVAVRISGLTVGGIQFNSTVGYTIAPGNFSSITFNDGNAATSVAFIDVAATDTANHTISANLVLADSLIIDHAGAGTLWLTGNISGTGKSLTKTGPGTLVLGASGNTNSYVGPTVITGGVVRVDHPRALGGDSGGDISVSGGAKVLFNTTGIRTGSIGGYEITLGDATLERAHSGVGNVILGPTGAPSQRGNLVVTGQALINNTAVDDGIVSRRFILRMDQVEVRDGGTLTLQTASNASLASTVLAGGGEIILRAGGSLTTTGPGWITFGDPNAVPETPAWIAEGTSLNEATLRLGALTNQFSHLPGGRRLTINGHGAGGLRVEAGVSRIIAPAGAGFAFLPADFVEGADGVNGLRGTGGTLTLAPTDAVATLAVGGAGDPASTLAAPAHALPVKLGIDRAGAGAAEYTIHGSATNMNNWGGLVVRETAGAVRAALASDWSPTGAAATSLDLLGGTLDLDGHDLELTGAATLVNGLLEGAATVSSTLRAQGITKSGNGTVTIAPNVVFDAGAGGFSMTGGTLRVGDPTAPATLSILGGYHQNGGSLELFVAGAGSYSSLLVDGVATLGGELHISLPMHYTPSPGQVFALFQADLITGTFVNLAPGGRLALVDGRGTFGTRLTAVPGGSQWELADFQAAVVAPEPSSVAFGILVASATLVARRPRRR